MFTISKSTFTFSLSSVFDRSRYFIAMQSTLKSLVGQNLLLAKQHFQIAAMSSLAKYKFETLLVTSPKEGVYNVQLNRPERLNAMNQAFWREMTECFTAISDDLDCRAVVISGNGKHFTAGLDLMDMAQGDLSVAMTDGDIARKYRSLQKIIKSYQLSFTSIEQCTKPVIAAVHNACIGGGVDLITAADIRYCSQDAFFQVKEVDIGMAADVGTLQRLPKVIGSTSLVRELAYTARKMFSDEALSCGLVNRVFPDRDSLMSGAVEMAVNIASKSPVAVQGTKHNLNFSRDHSVQEGLDYMVTWNAAMLQSEDVKLAAMASMDRNGPPAVYSKL